MKALAKVILSASMILISGTVQAQDKIIEIKKGQAAPFSGNLFPESITAKMAADADLMQATSQELASCAEEKNDMVSNRNMRDMEWFGAGSLVGVVLSAVLVSVAK